MTLREEFETSGGWLFKWRSYLPLVAVVLFLVAMIEYKYPFDSEEFHNISAIVAFIISFIGLGIRMYTIGFTPKNTSGRNTREQIADTLNTTGIYSVVRNPLYLGNYIMGLGIAVFTCFWWLVIIYTLIFWLYYERIIFAEEAYLQNKFGQPYTDWANKTPVFIPNFKNFEKAELEFSLKNILKREYNGFYSIVSTMFIFKIIGDFSYKGTVTLNDTWIAVIVIGTLIWAVLRFIKRNTKLLHVEGR